MAANLQYIAEGFHEDFDMLMSDFMDINSVEFSDFASIWRKHYFSLIFMGRPDDTEMTEFVNEMYRIVSELLSSPSFYQRIGAVYTLYALFRNQHSVPPIKIRIEESQWRAIKTLFIQALLKNYVSLRKIISYLRKHAFLYVSKQVLKGPLAGGSQTTVPKVDTSSSSLLTNYKADIIQYSVSSRLHVIRDLLAQKLEIEQRISNVLKKVDLTPRDEEYNKLIGHMHDIVNPSPVSKKKTSESLGCRRAKIKAKSFIKKTRDRYRRDSNDEDEIGSDIDTNYSPVKKSSAKKHIKRVPKHERRVGRPRKRPKVKTEPDSEPKSDDEDLDITHLLKQQKDFYLPPVEYEYKKARSRRDPYYRVSPRREGHKNDSDST